MSTIEPLCAVCCRPSPLGLVVCPECGGTAPQVADALVFIQPGDAPGGTSALGRRLTELLGAGTPDAWVVAASRGEKALVRVPRNAADPVSNWLALQGLPTHAVPARRAWAALPAAFLATLAAVLVAGGLAGALYSTWILLSTTLFLYLLATSATRNAARPLVGSERIAASPALAGYDALLRAVTALPPSPARDLAASLAGAARSVAGPDAALPVDPALHVELDAVLATAAEAARDVAVLDETLAAFADRVGGVSLDNWIAGRDHVLASRMRLENYLLEAKGLVGRVQGLGADAFDSAGERLRELNRELREVMATRASR